MRLRTRVVFNTFARLWAARLCGCCRESLAWVRLAVGLHKEKQVSDKLKEKAIGTGGAAPTGAKDGTLGAKDSVKRSAAKGGAAPTGAKDSVPTVPTGAKDGTLRAKD
jgi:hypothetical protein